MRFHNMMRQWCCRRPKIAVVAHLFYDDLAAEFMKYLKNIPVGYDLYISTKPEARDVLDKYYSNEIGRKRVKIRSVENRGRDMAPFVIEFKDDYPQYDLVCWLHSKKSTSYNSGLAGWREHLLENLLGSPKKISTIMSYFNRDAKLGLVFPEYYPAIERNIEWGANYNRVEKLAKRMNITIDPNAKLEFAAGSMFWFRPIALMPLFDLKIKLEDFENGSENMTDGTLAHAIERLILFVVEKQGYKYKKVRFINK